MAENKQLEPWQVDAIEILAQNPACGYRSSSSSQVEPTALALLALHSYMRAQAAKQAANWLADHQQTDGRVAAEETAEAPGWATALAILAWHSMDATRWDPNITLGVQYLLGVQGKVFTDHKRLVGHDTMIPGWSWIKGTHSWLEPTAMSVAALQATGHGQHPRAIDGRRLLVNRILPDGGCNYGNTFVLDQPIRPLAQPTGIAMLALAGQQTIGDGVAATLNYLESYLAGPVTTASASYALMALAAHGRSCDVGRIRTSAQETLARHAGPAHLALALLAAKGRDSALVRVCMESAS